MIIQILSALVQTPGLLVQFNFNKQFSVVEARDDSFTIRVINGEGEGQYTEYYFTETAEFEFGGLNNETLNVSDVQGFPCRFQFSHKVEDMLESALVDTDVSTDDMLKAMFFCLCNTPVKGETLSVPFLDWPAGTSLAEVTAWMDSQGNTFSVAEMLKQRDDAEKASQKKEMERLGALDTLIDPAFDSFQRLVLKTYAGGDMADVQKAGLHDCGDSLLTFLLVELSMQEDCDSAITAVNRLDNAIKQLTEVRSAFEKEAIGF